MKIFAIALLGVFYLALVAGYPVDDDDVRGVGVPREYRVAVENYLNTTLNSEVDTAYNAKHVKFYLYTMQQPERVELKFESVIQNWENSTFDPSRPTKVFIHDRLFSEYHYKELITAYLAHYPTPVNVITVDYSYYTGAEHKEFMKVYQEIGATVAKFVGKLCSYAGVTGNNIHVIGHGIGAHIAAVAARGVTPIKFDRITGLCPVGLEFDENKNLPQLQKSDADVVDVIVTNMAGVGSKQKGRGHINFYPNGGDSQPKSDMLISHLKSYFYYVESISRGKVFPSYAADSYVEWNDKKQSYHKVNYMGEYLEKNLAGNFYLDVNPVPPYGVATDSTFRSERVKFHQTYLSLILGSELEPWAFTPKNDPNFRKAVANQNTFYTGLGEKLNNYNNTDSKEYHENTLRYSNKSRV